MPGPLGTRRPVIVPVEGANPWPGCSALTRNSIACRRATVTGPGPEAPGPRAAATV